MFFRNFNPETASTHYELDRIIGQDYDVRPLTAHFEKERFITDKATRKALAEAGFIDLNVENVFLKYGKNTIDIREFAKVFGPNSEFIKEAFNIVDSSFKKAGISFNSKEYINYKGYMRDSINAYFGKYGQLSGGIHKIPAIGPISQNLVALGNMTYLTRVGITSLADFTSPLKSASLKSAARGVGVRLLRAKDTPAQRAGLRYNDDFELEFKALKAQSDDPLSSWTDRINTAQRLFFKIVGLKKVTELAGRYAFDVGAFRAFDVSKSLSKNKKITKPLQREIKEMGIRNEDLFYLAKFKSTIH